MRIRRALVIALLAVGAQPFALPGAHASQPGDTIVQEWYDQAVSASSITINLPIKGLRTGSTESCGLEFSYKVGYNKPRFSFHLHEEGEAKTSGGCNGFRKVQLTQNISDKGMALFSSTYNAPSSDQSDFDSPYAYLRAYSEQSVPGLTFPYDWHGFGSQIDWTARVNITWKPGWTGDTSACLHAFTIVPATPVFVPCA